MWTGTVVSVQKQTDNPINLKVTVDFSNDATGEKVKRAIIANDATDEYIAAFVKGNIAELEKRDVSLQAVTVGPVTPAPLPVSAQQQFLAALNNLGRLEVRVRLGVVQATSKEYTDAVAAAIALYQPGF
jgi:hypothetical protein